MAIHKLVLEDVFDEAEITLLAIYTNIEDYRLAFLLNTYLKTGFRRLKKDLILEKSNAVFSHFQWLDNTLQIQWNLVANHCKIETYQAPTTPNLFQLETSIVKHYYLVPEHKKSVYFLKINEQLPEKEEIQLLETILKIPLISTANKVESSTLKSKYNLIFN